MTITARHLPLPPGEWTLDPLHCTVEFTPRHMAISKVRGRFHAGFEATATISRTDYGVDFNVPLAAGGFVISDRIGIELDIQLLAPQNGGEQ